MARGPDLRRRSLAVNAAVYVAVTYSAPMNDTERNRVGQLFDRLSESKADPDPESRSSPDTESDSDTTSQYTHQ